MRRGEEQVNITFLAVPRGAAPTSEWSLCLVTAFTPSSCQAQTRGTSCSVLAPLGVPEPHWRAVGPELGPRQAERAH
jgi:hypothetical protein